MLITIGKAHHFVFDRRAITRPIPSITGIHWAAIEVIADHVMGFLVGMRDVARYLLRMLSRIAREREHRHRVIAVLLCQHAEINGARINTRGGVPVFRRLTRSGSSRRRRESGIDGGSPAGHRCSYPDQYGFYRQECPDRQHHRFCANLRPHLGHGAHNTIVLHDKIFNRLLEDHQVRLVFQRGATA